MRPVPYRKAGGRYRARRMRATSSCSDTMDRLMRLVVAQGETIQTQLRRLNQRESQIENYEQQMHLLRVQSLGNDYLLSSYLQDQHNQQQQSATSNPAIKGVQYGATSQNNPMMSQQSQNGDINKILEKNLKFLQSEDNNKLARNGLRNNIIHPANYHLSNLVEEKSNDSGIALNEESSTDERASLWDKENSLELQDEEEQFQMLAKIEEIITKLLHEEEVIHGLSGTLEVVQTQQKLETAELEEDLERVAEDHSLLVAEARANEQQIRVMDTSCTQKKKLIDALLQEEADSDQETRALQAHLDYIIHLPPTAFRLAEEGDDPPPLYPPPQYPPMCMVQPLVGHQPPQLVHTNGSPQLQAKDNVKREPSPNVIPPPSQPPPPPYEKVAPSLSSLHRSENQNSIRVNSAKVNSNSLPNDKASVTISNNNNKNNLLNNYKNFVNDDDLNVCRCSKNIVNNNSKSSIENVCIKCKLRSSISRKNSINQKLLSNDKILTKRIYDEDINSTTDDEVPPPLPQCPPPLLDEDNNATDKSKNYQTKISSTNAPSIKQPLGHSKNNVSFNNKPLFSSSEAFISSLPVKCRSSTSSDSSTTNSSTASSTGVPSSTIIKYPIKPILKNRTPGLTALKGNGKIMEDHQSMRRIMNGSNKMLSFSENKKEDSVDSNSDTGLSSLHSSSDEGFGGALDTLV